MVNTIDATLDTHLRVPVGALPDDVLGGIQEALSFENREKIEARKEKRYGWTHMPDEIELWQTDGDELVLPRGFRWQFEQGMADFGCAVRIDDRRTGERVLKLAPPFPLRPHQGPAADAILEAQDGIYQAPAGSGKTVTVLEVVRRARMAHNIVVINRIELADQWEDRAAAFLGENFPVGIIGDGEWDDNQRLVIATVQSLYAKRDQLDRDGWWSKFGLSCLDEMHHQTAESFEEVMSRFPSMLRFGVSATPDKTGDFERAEAVLGDIIHVTTRHELRESGILVRPTIRVVHTGFDFPFHSTFTANAFKPCGVAGCKKSAKKKHLHRNNYTSMMKALRTDDQRNREIVRWIAAEQSHRQLVVSPQKGHLELLELIYGTSQHTRVDQDPAYMLTGSESRKERQRVVDAIMDGPCVVFSTIADEALDVPPLDRLHMVWPTKNLGAVRQRVGRVERAWPGKEDAVVYDHADTEQPVLCKQFAERRWGVYAEELYKVEHVGGED